MRSCSISSASSFAAANEPPSAAAPIIVLLTVHPQAADRAAQSIAYVCRRLHIQTQAVAGFFGRLGATATDSISEAEDRRHGCDPNSATAVACGRDDFSPARQWHAH